MTTVWPLQPYQNHLSPVASSTMISCSFSLYSYRIKFIITFSGILKIDKFKVNLSQCRWKTAPNVTSLTNVSSTKTREKSTHSTVKVNSSTCHSTTSKKLLTQIAQTCRLVTCTSSLTNVSLLNLLKKSYSSSKNTTKKTVSIIGRSISRCHIKEHFSSSKAILEFRLRPTIRYSFI